MNFVGAMGVGFISAAIIAPLVVALLTGRGIGAGEDVPRPTADVA